MIIFTIADRDLKHLDIARGPHVPAPSRPKPLVGAFSLGTGTRAGMESLFTLLVASPTKGPWADIQTGGDARLHTFSEEFAEALAQFSTKYQDRPKDDIERDAVHDRLDELTAAWATARGSTATRSDRHVISKAAWEAKRAAQHGWTLYAWFGPTMGHQISIERITRHVTLRDAD